MKGMDKKSLFQDLIQAYRDSHKKSEAHFLKASHFQIRGGSHNLRLFEPFPFYDTQCQGSRITDLDGNSYVDFWQGHFGNILGHNPPFMLDTLIDFFKHGNGLSTGYPSTLQSELAEFLLSRLSADKIRFSTSGTLATMYAVMLSKAKTGRDLVMKVGGGWHGSQPYTLKGISIYDKGLTKMESAGLPPGMDEMIIITRFNDKDDLEEKFRRYGDRTACLILEPFIGAGGFIFGNKDYIQRVRHLCDQFESLLIFDEVVSGFRFHAGALQNLYDVRPDLSVFGKAIGGGMPLSAVAGKGEILELCGAGKSKDKMVKVEGGTFSAHPASMMAGLTFTQYLQDNEQDIYPRIGRLGERVRTEIEKIFTAYGFHVRCTGDGNPVAKNSSIVGVHFLHDPSVRIESPEQVWNPDVCDIEMRENIFKLAMIQEGFNVFHGYGSISAAHTDEEIQASLDAVERIARKWKGER